MENTIHHGGALARSLSLRVMLSHLDWCRQGWRNTVNMCLRAKHAAVPPPRQGCRTTALPGSVHSGALARVGIVTRDTPSVVALFTGAVQHRDNGGTLFL